jgi:hypothetical protein
MPRILELKVVKGKLWARIPGFPDGEEGKNGVTLWTEAEKQEVLKCEREKCVHAIEQLGRLNQVDELVRDVGMSDAGSVN